VPDDTLPVHVNRAELHALEVPDSFEASDSFDLRLVNHGQSVHVHLHLDDALSEVATVDASNHFVDGQSERALRVHVNGDGTARGRLKIASAYGAETRYIDIEIVEPEKSEEAVTVDDSLSQPQPRPTDTDSEPLGGVSDSPELGVLGLGVLAVVVAAVAALIIDSTIVLVGALAVLVGVLVAMYLLVAG